jgi:hypothetical protein
MLKLAIMFILALGVGFSVAAQKCSAQPAPGFECNINPPPSASCELYYGPSANYPVSCGGSNACTPYGGGCSMLFVAKQVIATGPGYTNTLLRFASPGILDNGEWTQRQYHDCIGQTPCTRCDYDFSLGQFACQADTNLSHSLGFYIAVNFTGIPCNFGDVVAVVDDPEVPPVP